MTATPVRRNVTPSDVAAACTCGSGPAPWTWSSVRDLLGRTNYEEFCQAVRPVLGDLPPWEEIGPEAREQYRRRDQRLVPVLLAALRGDR